MLAALLIALAVAVSPTRHAKPSLWSESVTAPRTGTLDLLLRIELDPNWHVYWLNAGAAGLPPRIEWTPVEGMTPGELLFPVPDTIPVAPLMTYGYHDSVAFPLTLTLDGVRGDTLRLRGVVKSLVCNDICLPEEAPVSLDLPLSDQPSMAAPGRSAAFARARFQLPIEIPGTRARLLWGDSLAALEVTGAGTPDRARLFPALPGVVDDAAHQALQPLPDGFRVVFVRDPFLRTRPDSLVAVLRTPGGWRGEGSEPGLLVRAVSSDSVGDAALATLPEAGPPPDSAPAGAGLLAALLAALLGGLLLNLMPCVLPVLSLKVLDLLRHAGSDRREALRHAAAYTIGAVLSFAALGGILAALRAGGSAIGWGFQLQSPVAVGVLSLLMVLVALSFWGVYEAGAGLTRLGGTKATGLLGSLSTGVLATIVATPCTAPFMGAALGWTLVRPPLEGLLVFATLGLGMALPVPLLVAFPPLARRLPRPGAWMETLKQVLGFAMAATALWLAWVLGRLAGPDALATVVGAWLLVGLGSWILGRWAAPHCRAGVRNLARLAFLATLVGAVVLVANLPAREASPQTAPTGSHTEVWRPGILQELRASGKPWFLHATADWCLSCKVNERTSLDRPEVIEAMAAKGVRHVVADWTDRDPALAAELAGLGRQGVPVYLLSDGTTERFLPELLTKGLVLEALEPLPSP